MSEDEKLRIAVDALHAVLWHKECGCDFYDEKIGRHRNYPDVERDAMYRDALVALDKIGMLEESQHFSSMRSKFVGQDSK